MKTSINLRRAGIGCAAIAAALASAAALAGIRYGQPSVSINAYPEGGGVVMGTLGGVRNSTSNERLSCTVTRSETTNSAGRVSRSTVVSCGARDANNVVVNCTSRNEALAVPLDGASNDSLIEFHYDAAAQCTNIIVYESASLERKR
jgi:hypothetical protein